MRLLSISRLKQMTFDIGQIHPCRRFRVLFYHQLDLMKLSLPSLYLPKDSFYMYNDHDNE